jgi:hypothetical protein
MAGAEATGRSWRRWRWRLRGATMWPAFAVGVAVDIAVLMTLPPWGTDMAAVDAFLIAGAANLFVVAVAGPMAALALRRRRSDLPRVVARDYAGTALLVVLAVALLAAGLAHRPDVLGAQRAFQAQSDAMRRYVITQAPAEYRTRIDRADSVRLDSQLYRTCVPGNDPQLALCLFIDTSQSPPGVRLDSDRAPNWRYFNRRPGAFSAG